MKTIDVYISPTSPWTYLSCEPLAEIAARHGWELAVYPARFSTVFAQTGGLPLGKRSPERQAYRMMELRRWSARRGVPLVLEPARFRTDEMSAVSMLLAARTRGDDVLALLREIGRALWERDEDIADAQVLDAAMLRAGLDAAALRKDAPDRDTTEAAYADGTQRALDAGVFGAPSFVLPDGEIFWGQDRLDMLDWRLTLMAAEQRQ